MSVSDSTATAYSGESSQQMRIWKDRALKISKIAGTAIASLIGAALALGALYVIGMIATVCVMACAKADGMIVPMPTLRDFLITSAIMGGIVVPIGGALFLCRACKECRLP